MPRHRLFFIHGMGQPDEATWHKEAEDTLRAAWKGYPDVADIDWDSRINVTPK